MGTHMDVAYYLYEKNTTTLNRDFLHTIQTKADEYVIYADLCTLSQRELENGIFHSKKNTTRHQKNVKERWIMKLKTYQETVLQDLSSFIDAVDCENDIIKGWKKYWGNKDIPVGFNGVPYYQNKIENTPHVCIKVPTGGGKTFIACSAVKTIFEHFPVNKPKVVVWLVPSDSILTQTLRTLSDVNHPYRQRLDMDFAGRVGVYTKEMLLNGQNFSPDSVREMLTICVLSYSSLRIDSRKKDVRKVYQENGNLFRFAEQFDDESVLLADTPDTALIQILRFLSPVTVVDESHNAGSTLSAEMLNNLNPSFILELTATPRSTSNIISYVDARELKKKIWLNCLLLYSTETADRRLFRTQFSFAVIWKNKPTPNSFLVENIYVQLCYFRHSQKSMKKAIPSIKSENF